MKYEELEKGMRLWRDRQDYVDDSDEWFAYIELLEILSIDKKEARILRQQIYVTGKETDTQYEVAKEFAGKSSSPSTMRHTTESWNEDWADIRLYTEEEIKRRIINYCFDRAKGI